MIAVIFEFIPNAERKQEYLDIAAKLRPQLEKLDGFMSIERFQSITEPRKILSLSFWRDEGAVKRWRTDPHHREAQTNGRLAIFKDYRLRVTEVLRDYGMHDRSETPADSAVVHDGG